MTTYSQAIAFTVDMIVTNRFILLVGCFWGHTLQDSWMEAGPNGALVAPRLCVLRVPQCRVHGWHSSGGNGATTLGHRYSSLWVALLRLLHLTREQSSEDGWHMVHDHTQVSHSLFSSMWTGYGVVGAIRMGRVIIPPPLSKQALWGKCLNSDLLSNLEYEVHKMSHSEPGPCFQTTQVSLLTFCCIKC
jgi:hypothetical protein